MVFPSRHDVFRAALIAAAALAATPASAAIFRCTAADGSVSYQETECSAADQSHVMDVPTQYPTADPAERARLFEREAALDRRLEAQRERDSREALFTCGNCVGISSMRVCSVSAHSISW